MTISMNTTVGSFDAPAATTEEKHDSKVVHLFGATDVATANNTSDSDKAREGILRVLKIRHNDLLSGSDVRSARIECLRFHQEWNHMARAAWVKADTKFFDLAYARAEIWGEMHDELAGKVWWRFNGADLRAETQAWADEAKATSAASAMREDRMTTARESQKAGFSALTAQQAADEALESSHRAQRAAADAVKTIEELKAELALELAAVTQLLSVAAKEAQVHAEYARSVAKETAEAVVAENFTALRQTLSAEIEAKVALGIQAEIDRQLEAAKVAKATKANKPEAAKPGEAAKA